MITAWIRKRAQYLTGIIVILFFIFWTFLLYYVSPEGIVEWIGVENAYVMIFVMALLGGLTTFSGIPYHIVLISLAVSGLNPWLLGSVTALGVMIGDSTSYYIGYQGRILMAQKAHTWLERISFIKEKYPRLLPFVFLLYGSFIPFSNDVITIPMGFLHYPFWEVMIPLGIGNILFNVSLAFLATYAYDGLQGIFF